MRYSAVASIVASVILVCLTNSCHAQSSTDSVQRADAANSAESQQKPEEILKRMSDYLAGLSAFTCRISSAIEIKAQGASHSMTTELDLRLARPNRIFLTVKQDMRGITLVSDGQQLIQFSPSLNRYTVQPAPAEFSELVDDEGAVAVPVMGQLGSYIPTDGKAFFESLMAGVTKAEYLGTEKVGEILCHHCRFQQEGLSWDIWIETGDRPLVHKVVPDISQQFAEADQEEMAAKLEWVVTFFDWNVEPKLSDADFAFTPPEDAEKVDTLYEGMAEEGPHPLVGQPAPAFQTVDVDGNEIDLQADLGKKLILLDFWATWCGPCVAAMPEIDAVAEKFADRGLLFYSVNVGEDSASVKAFLAENKLDVPVIMDPDGSISSLYKVDGIPQTVLIGKDGKVQVVHVGFGTELGKLLTQNLDDLLAGKDLAAEALAESDKSDDDASKPDR